MVEMCQPEITLIGVTCVRSIMTRAGPPQARPSFQIVVAFRRCRMLGRPAGQDRRHTDLIRHHSVHNAYRIRAPVVDAGEDGPSGAEAVALAWRGLQRYC